MVDITKYTIEQHPITLWQEQNSIVYANEVPEEYNLSQEEIDTIIVSLKIALMEGNDKN